LKQEDKVVMLIIVMKLCSSPAYASHY